MASRRLTHAELARLDDSTYREYCRADRLEAATVGKRGKSTLRAGVDLVITTLLLVAVLIVVLQHMQVIPKPEF